MCLRLPVTGSVGHVGRAVCRRVLSQHRVIDLGVLPSMSTDVVASVCDASALRAVLRDIDVAVHAAALHWVPCCGFQAVLDNLGRGSLEVLPPP